MLNMKDPGGHICTCQPFVPRSVEEYLAPYAQGPDDLDAALAGLCREDLDQVRVGQRTIRQLVEHIVDDDAYWTMCMQVAVVRPGYTYGPGWRRRTRTGSGEGTDLAAVLTRFRANRTHMLTLLHHVPDARTRSVTLRRAAEQDAHTLTVGHMVGIQATHALAHIDEIRRARGIHR